jgi:hypothetical protein
MRYSRCRPLRGTFNTINLYMTRRIDKITVREVTTKAGYKRGTFYEYFRNVYDVLEQIEAQAPPSFEEFPPMMDAG